MHEDGDNLLVWDGADVVMTVNKWNGDETLYYRGLTLIAFDDPNGDRYYYHHNAKGDVVALSDEFGDRVIKYSYDPYGVLLDEDYDPYTVSQSVLDNPFRYCGEYYVISSDLIYLRNRFYSPEMRRFLNEDPARSGNNWFAYCSGNPVMLTDPWGLQADQWGEYSPLNPNAGKPGYDSIGRPMPIDTGADVYIFYDPNMFEKESAKDYALVNKAELEQIYGVGSVRAIPIMTRTDFEKAWKMLPDKIRLLMLFFHSTRSWIGFDTHFEDIDGDGVNNIINGTYITRSDIAGLDNKNIDTLILYGCNMGYTGYETPDNTYGSIAQVFSNKAGIGTVIAADGNISCSITTVTSGWWLWKTETKYHTVTVGPHSEYHTSNNIEPEGFKVYRDGQVVQKIGSSFSCLTALLRVARVI